MPMVSPYVHTHPDQLRRCGHYRHPRSKRSSQMNVLSLVIFAAMMGAALSAVMAVAWRVQLTTRNTGWIDVFWTFGLGAIAIIASLVPLSDDPWPHSRQIMIATLVAAWSLRLGWHLLMRTNTVGDDPRYRQLIIQWGTDAARQMFWQLQKQAAVSLVLAISIVLAAQKSKSGPARPGRARVDYPDCGHCRRGSFGSSAPSVQGRSRQPQFGVRRWSLAVVTTSKLFLRMAVVAGISDDRN